MICAVPSCSRSSRPLRESLVVVEGFRVQHTVHTTICCSMLLLHLHLLCFFVLTVSMYIYIYMYIHSILQVISFLPLLPLMLKLTLKQDLKIKIEFNIYPYMHECMYVCMYVCISTFQALDAQICNGYVVEVCQLWSVRLLRFVRGTLRLPRLGV